MREETTTRELTLDELDAQLAEQLPVRELMGSYCNPCNSCCPQPPECEVHISICASLDV